MWGRENLLPHTHSNNDVSINSVQQLVLQKSGIPLAASALYTYDYKHSTPINYIGCSISIEEKEIHDVVDLNLVTSLKNCMLMWVCVRLLIEKTPSLQ